MTPSKTYLADGVYADDDGCHVILTTDGNTIYLDTQVLSELFSYIEKARGVKIAVERCP